MFNKFESHSLLSALLVLTVIFVLSFQAQSHERDDHKKPLGPEGVIKINWPEPDISSLISAAVGENFGSESFPRLGFPVVHMEGESLCATGSYLAFDIDDNFAFDIDEKVEISFRLKSNGNHAVEYAYDRNAMAETYFKLAIDELNEEWHFITLSLERARFANRGQANTDFMLVPFAALKESLILDKSHRVSVCDVKIKRSNTTPKKTKYGQVEINVFDEGQLVPVRMGIYDSTGRMPLPSSDSVPFQHYARTVVQHYLRDTKGSHEPWPAENRHFFYSNGNYQAKLPVGKYSLVISKGPEYQIFTSSFEVLSKEANNVNIQLKRFIDLPNQNWYSGDGHIHLSRNKKEDNAKVITLLAAEDVHMSNLLQMGNFSNTYFNQYAFSDEGRYVKGQHAISSGVEDPRTAHRGHTIGLNVKAPIHDRENYYLYHRVFEKYQQQGAITGYAHVDTGWFNEDRGLALDMPFGLVDFVEIMQSGALHTKQWYDFLNLGYKLSPMAGSDYPYIDQPGAVRTYAKVSGEFSALTWFNAVKQGTVFVSNAPFLNLTVNGKPMGATIEILPEELLTINAMVTLNPDYDDLDRIELVVHGEIVAVVHAQDGQQSLMLSKTMQPKEGLWLAVRAYGKNQALAHSAPVYVNIGNSSHMSTDKAPVIAKQMIKMLKQMKTTPNALFELEYWDIKIGFEPLWEKQKSEIFIRIDKAIKHYSLLSKE